MAAYSRISWSVSDADEPGTRCETVATTTAAMRTAAEGRRFVTTAAAASTRCEIARSRIRTLRLPSVSSAIKSDTCRGIVRRIRAGLYVNGGQCRICKGVDHLARDCPKQGVCLRCGEVRTSLERVSE